MKEKYVIDMVRLKVRIEKKGMEKELQRIIDKYEVKMWIDSKYKSYNKNFNFLDYNLWGEEVSFWCGCEHNSEKKSRSTNLVVEYNPSKCIGVKSLNEILMKFYSSSNVMISSVDLACDMPCNILNVFIPKDCKRIKMTYDLGQDNKTIYLGKGDGRIKLYNKALELGLKNRELTRYEISLKVDLLMSGYERFSIDENKIVPVYIINSEQNDLKCDNGTDRALVYAVLNNFPIEELPRRKQQKIKDILKSSSQFTVSVKELLKEFCLYFKSLLNDLSSYNFVELVPTHESFKAFAKFIDDK